jgi:hypothetical protein
VIVEIGIRRDKGLGIWNWVFRTNLTYKFQIPNSKFPIPNPNYHFPIKTNSHNNNAHIRGIIKII